MERRRFLESLLLIWSFLFPLTGLSIAESPDRQLYNAIEKGDLESFHDALKAGASVTPIKNPGFPLCAAIEHNRLEMVQILLDGGADINRPNHLGATPLIAALRAGDPYIEMLLTRKVDVTIQTKEGGAIYHACLLNRPNIALRLIELGAPTDPTSDDKNPIVALASNWPPLHASQEIHLKLLGTLLEKGVNPERGDRYGETAIDLAIKRGSPDLLDALDKAGKYVEKRKELRRHFNDLRLESAVQYHDLAAVRRALSEGANPNGIEPQTGYTFLGFACTDEYVKDMRLITGDPELVATLLKGGADLKLPVNGELPAVVAAAANPKVLEILLTAGADPKAADSKTGQTPLHHASLCGQKDSAQLLLDRSVDIDARTKDGGLTPLHVALSNGNSEVTDLLLKQGANAKLNASDGRTSADFAALAWDVSMAHKMGMESNQSAQLKHFNPPKGAPQVGRWEGVVQGVSISLELEPDGGGRINFVELRPIAWKPADDGILMRMSFRSSRETQGLQFTDMIGECPVPGVLRLKTENGGVNMMLHRPGVDLAAIKIPQKHDPNSQDLEAEYAKARIESEPMLNIYDPGMTEIPEKMFQFTNLQKLWFQNTPLRRLPGKLSHFSHLKHFMAANCNLVLIDDEFYNLPDLQSLSLTRNQFTAISSNLWHLTNLETLELYDNRIEDLPEGWEQMKNLKHLNLTSNRLKKLPESLGRAPCLERLAVAENMLTEIPTSIGDSKTLASVWLENNRLTQFPLVLCRMSALKSIGLGNNQLKEIPSEISRVATLEEIDLSDNYLTSFPVAIRNLPLKRLLLRGNSITEFPASADFLSPNLEELDLSRNQISKIPEWVHTLPVRVLNLDGNPLPREQVQKLREELWEKNSRKRKQK